MIRPRAARAGSVRGRAKPDGPGRAGLAPLLLAGLFLAAPPAAADALRYCDRQLHLTAHDEDQLFRLAGIVKTTLAQSGERVAIVARSGLDLSRFGVRYSHAGLGLRDSANAPWSVRQLYYACDEGRSRIFDQGLPGFLLGTDDPHVGYLSVVLLPPAQAAAAEAAGLDNAQALALLSGEYSANAYPFSVKYQNCNGWLEELLAVAWAPSWPVGEPAGPAAPVAPGTPVAPGEPPVESDTPPPPRTRADAQRWLATHGYHPSVVEAGAYMPLASFIPHLHNDDHPDEELRQRRFTVGLPAGLEAFVHAQLPGATRIEFCHAGPRVVVHRGWTPVAEGCVPGPDDEVVTLD